MPSTQPQISTNAYTHSYQRRKKNTKNLIILKYLILGSCLTVYTVEQPDKIYYFVSLLYRTHILIYVYVQHTNRIKLNLENIMVKQNYLIDETLKTWFTIQEFRLKLNDRMQLLVLWVSCIIIVIKNKSLYYKCPCLHTVTIHYTMAFSCSMKL